MSAAVVTPASSSKRMKREPGVSPAHQTPSALANRKSSVSGINPAALNTPDSYQLYHHSNPATHNPQLRDLWRPHVESFNFAMGEGLDLIVPGIEKQIVDVPVNNTAPRNARTNGAQPTEDAAAAAAAPATRPFKYWIDKVQIGTPQKSDDSLDTRLMPNECRSLSASYSGPLMATICYQQSTDAPVQSFVKKLGNVPIMVRSSKCHMQNFTQRDLHHKGEETVEYGGYFIVNGNERLVRLLVLPKRHYVMALIRPSYQNRGSEYSKFATSMRCVRADQTSKSLTCHYLNSGALSLRISVRKQEFFIPAILVLKALLPTCTDKFIYTCIVDGHHSSNFLTDRVELMLIEGHRTGFQTQSQILQHFGRTFRILMRPPTGMSDEDVGRLFLDEYFFIHCYHEKTAAANNLAKFHALVHMIRKTYALAEGRIKADNPDALSNQEVALPGHLYLMILKEKLTEYLQAVKTVIMTDLRLKPHKVTLQSSTGGYFRQVLDSVPDVGKQMHYFIVTGNLRSSTGLDLMQTSGYTIVAEKLNYMRYLAHFRAVHRGQFFTTLKTTDVRKLLPESFGFFCPVHTPDGAPCGLINHLTFSTSIVTHPTPITHTRINHVLYSLGVIPTSTYNAEYVQQDSHHLQYLTVTLDGISVGKLPYNKVNYFTYMLRKFKNDRKFVDVPLTTEIYIIPDNSDGLYPEIILYTTPARLMRPVQYIVVDEESTHDDYTEQKEFDTSHSSAKQAPRTLIEWISPQEQLTLDIAIKPIDFRLGETTHMEIAPNYMFSVVSSFTPFSDFNQSPRNMYQCQMGKQTMGTPYHAMMHRTDNKVFRIQNPQSPLVRNETYERYGVDEYPTGCNAVVAVIAYTGYDMEDAMIINKHSYERGWGHASVYKYREVNLAENKNTTNTGNLLITNKAPSEGTSAAAALQRGKHWSAEQSANSGLITDQLDSDGLPPVGAMITAGTPIYSVINDTTKKTSLDVYKDNEPCRIEDVRLMGDVAAAGSTGGVQHVGIKIRYNRNPVVGDKFASRAGQKGVLSILYPSVDMPFTESGMSPDVIINPHAFPSRMTIGMLIESMAGKSGSLNGRFQSGSPFRFDEENTAVEYFGQQLVNAGYAYAGTEPVYSGISGQLMQANIFVGLVYYQRLRHMVSDKSQVRATGPINAITRQPIKGRKVHGGIRFGEMERDSLLGHGVAYMLHDRLMNSSDYHTTPVCTICGSLLSPTPVNKNASAGAHIPGGVQPSATGSKKPTIICRECNTGQGCATVAIPYVFMYLVNELAAMNIKLTVDVKAV